MRALNAAMAALSLLLAPAPPAAGQAPYLKARGYIDRVIFGGYCMQGSHSIIDPCTGQAALLESVQLDLDNFLCQHAEAMGPDVGVECPVMSVDYVLPVDPACAIEVVGAFMSGYLDNASLYWHPQACVGAYDVIGGVMQGLLAGSGWVDLGAVSCLANDLGKHSIYLNVPDIPPPGQVLFYLIRARGEPYGLTSYGFSSSGLVRIPSAGDCPQ